MNALLVIFGLLTTIVVLVYVLAKKRLNYWKNKNVPFMKPLPILGNYGRYILLQEYQGHVIQKLCKQFPGLPYFGAFFGTEPVLIVQSPELFRQVFTKDFYYFHGREISKYQTKESNTQNLFFSSGDRWKIVRQNLTPLFSSAKMKNMFYLIEKCSYVFEDVLDKEIGQSNKIDVKHLSARFTMDCICSCAFGIESNTMTAPKDNPFRMMADVIFNFSTYRGFKIVFRAIWPALFYGLGFKCFPSTIEIFFSRLLKGVFESRNYKPSGRNDFVDLVLNWKKEDIIVGDSVNNVKTGLDEKVQLKVDDTVLVAQCVMFFGAGFETAAATLSFTLYELAMNLEVQKRAAKEVDEYLRRHNNKLGYQCLKELPYLDACLCETLRKYPVLGNLTREVMDDVTLPDGLHLEKGLRIHIPVYTLHHNPQHFPEPESYKPERFLAANRDDIKQYTFLPFGEGPRVCIGKRFSKMMLLSGLVTILKKFRLELAEGMPKTVEFESKTFLTQPKGGQGLMLKVSKREGWKQRQFVRTYNCDK